MPRRAFLKRLGLSAAAAMTPSWVGCTAPRPKPNVLFILVDDLGWKDLGCYGSTFYETPHIDRLAASASRFTNGYASCPVCSPTRASLLTGKHPARLGITDWIPGLRPRGRKLECPAIANQLPLEEVTLAERFQGAGYQTFFAGKWHLGGAGFYPEQQGFAMNQGGYERGQPANGYYVPYRNPKLADGPEGEYLTDRLTDEAIRFMETNHEQPFLLFLSYYTVHTPIEACKKHLDRFQAKTAALPEKEVPDQRPEGPAFSKLRQDHAAYASMIHSLDENVGRLLDRLAGLGLTDNTVVIFTSDNGGLSTLPRKGYPTSNLPLRAGKGWCYEGGIRVPLIIRAPGLTSAGACSSQPVTSMDFYPTLLDLAGLPPDPNQHRDGLNLTGHLRDQRPLDREALYWHYPHYHGSAWTPGAAIRKGDWKLIEFYEEKRVELYHLKTDPGEKKDRAATDGAIRDQLLEKLHNWQEGIGAQMPRRAPGSPTPG